MFFRLRTNGDPADPVQKSLYFAHHHLTLPEDARSYHAGAELAEICAGKAIIESGDATFDVHGYAQAGLCTLTPRPGPHPQLLAMWDSETQAIERMIRNAWLQVTWQDRPIDLLVLVDPSANAGSTTWIIAESIDLAESFFRAVCSWAAQVHDEVLIFEDGFWRKSDELFQAIQSASWDDLILPTPLKQQIATDIAGFFTARETYARYQVPWKRGVIFIGPPGNGKTFAVKALVNMLQRPCLYVKSIDSDRRHEHGNLRRVFDRARAMAPCVLVLEDLDTLLTSANRSYILNELDGFAGNDGILTLATTNYPEKLDPAILDRPSRFDRKYHFELPAAPERRAYLARWNTRLGAELQLSEDGLQSAVDLTEGFSFAYLKELMVSATMAWMSTARPGAMDAVIGEQAQLLRSQMRTSQAVDLEE